MCPGRISISDEAKEGCFMNRQYARKHTARRVLAVLLSLLMLLQSVSAFAENIDVPETTPEEITEAAGQTPEIPEEAIAEIPADPAETADVPAGNSNAPETTDEALEKPAADEDGTAEQAPEAPAGNTDGPEELQDIPDVPAVSAEEPAEATEIPADNPEPAAADEETPAEDNGTPEEYPETPADNSEIPAGDAGTPGENPEPPADDEEMLAEAETAPEPTPVIDTSESITMLMAGYVPAPVWFEGTLVHEGADYTVTAVIGQDAMFPADVSMRVAEILPGTELYEFYIQMMEETMEEDEEIGEFVRFFDIAFIAEVDGEETEIEPQAEIDVQITFREAIAVTEETDVQAVHIEDDVPQILDASTDSLEAAVHDDEAIDTVSFSSDSFSVYGVYQKVKKILKVITASGETFTIDVTFTSDSGIPDDADLTATEITEGSPEYEMYRAQAVLALDAGDVGSAHFFDITISKNGEKIEPSGPVTVTIALDEMPENADNVAVIHFGDEATDVIEDVELSDTDVQFQAESFSVYGVITDPTNEVNNLNGKIATISRNGEYLTGTTLNTTPRMIGKTRNASEAAQYYFVSTGEAGKYYVYTIDPETQSKLYVNFKYRGGQSREADCFLSGDPQELNVEQFGNDYRISWRHPAGTSFAMDYWQGGGGQGFGGYAVGSGGGISDNHRMRLNFINGDEPSETKYVVIIKHEGEYYTVQADGTLVPCVYHEDTNLVELESPVMWTYSSVNGGNNLKITEEAIAFTPNLLPTQFSYRYINPNEADGITNEQVIDYGDHKEAVSEARNSALQYENHNLHGVWSNSGNYIGVSEDKGKLSISGLNSAADAAEVYLAVPMLPSSAYGKTNAVNHIDISVKGSANMNIAFPYGTYYDEDGNEIVVDKDHPITYSVEGYDIVVKQEDMMRSEISAYKVNSDGSQTLLDDMFYVTGYSDNGRNDGPSDSDQVRIEGFFKVSYTNVPGQNGNAESRAARLATPVYYTVTVPKSVTIPLEYNGKKIYKENPVGSGNLEEAKVDTTVILSASFTYWDFVNNKCPGCTMNIGGDWQAGDIPDGGGDFIVASGMDFELKYIGGTGTFAIEIVKYVVDEHGLPVQVASEPKYTFDVYYSRNKDANYVEQYYGVTDPSVLNTLGLESYTRLHTQIAQVGTNGSGVLYDYDAGSLVSDSTYAMIYIKEDPESIDQKIVDVNGETWEYTGKTTIVTEYVARSERHDEDHVVQSYTSFPEVLGHFRYYDSSGQNGTEKDSRFLEFHVYNEYTNRKSEIQITKFVVDENKNVINPMTPVESVFYLYGKSGNPDDMIGINKGSYERDFDTSAYTTDANLMNPVPVPVGANGWNYTYYTAVPGKLYTITEDKDSIPEQIVDTEGYIWNYTGTEILTEFAWRGEGDEGVRHYSKTYTRADDVYAAVPEILGAYTGYDGSALYNGYLDFFVYNKYTKTQQMVDSEKLNLQLNKRWDKNGDSTPPANGTVTFLLHQVKKTTTTTSSGGGGEEPELITVELYAKDRQTKLYSVTGEMDDTIQFNFQTSNPWSGANICVQPLNQSWSDTLKYIQSRENRTGSFTYTISSRHVLGGKVKLFFDNDIAGFQVTSTSGGGGSSGSSSTPTEETVTVTTEQDPDGSGFPMEIQISGDTNWTWQGQNLLAKVVRGNTTTEYSYWLQEEERTGKARPYVKYSFENDVGKDKDHAVSGTGLQIVNVTNSYDNSYPENELISVKKSWKDQDGNDLINHPTEITAKVYRIKLPVMASYTDEVKFKPVGGPYDVIGQPTTWQDNGNEILNDVVFYYNGYYYYVRKGQFIFNRAQLQGWIGQLDRGEMDGDHTTRLTGKVYTSIDEVKQLAAANQYIERGDICIYEGDYWVFCHTSGPFGTKSHTYGPDVDGNWRKIGKANFYSGITIDLKQNSEYYTEDEIRTQTIPELYAFIEQQLAGTGITWTDADKTPELYMQNVVIAENTNWETDFSAEAGYLYFVFEDPIPGYTTTYGYEEYGVFDQDQNIEIVNTTTRGELDVTKTWAGENNADRIYFTVKRNGTDITADIVTAPTSYGLTESDVNRNANHLSLIVPKGSNGWDTLKIKNLLLADYKPDPADDIPYVYSIQEIGYRDAGVDYWSVDEFLIGYSMSEPGQETANTGNQESGGVKVTGTTASTITIHNETPTELSFTKVWRKNGNIQTWREPIAVTLNAYADDPDENALEGSSYTLSPDSHAGWTAMENEDGSVTFTIRGLRAFDGTGSALTYYVQESAVTGYTTTYADAAGQKIEGGDRALDGQMIINTAYADIRVIKQNAATRQPLTGAEFRLDRKTENGYENGTATAVGDDGTLVFEGLADGEYRITETEGPPGYVPLASPIKFTVEDGVVSYTGTSDLVTYTAAAGNDPYTFAVDNKPGLKLPSTGGSGTAAYTLGGLALMILAGILLAERKRKAHK